MGREEDSVGLWYLLLVPGLWLFFAFGLLASAVLLVFDLIDRGGELIRKARGRRDEVRVPKVR